MNFNVEYTYAECRCYQIDTDINYNQLVPHIDGYSCPLVHNIHEQPVFGHVKMKDCRKHTDFTPFWMLFFAVSLKMKRKEDRGGDNKHQKPDRFRFLR